MEINTAEQKEELELLGIEIQDETADANDSITEENALLEQEIEKAKTDEETRAEDKILAKQMRGSRQFCDRDIFSHLCYRNFAHMEAIPFITSIQRVTFLKEPRESFLEKQLKGGQPFDNGVLWCITKMWTNRQNFNGRVLWNCYLRRLIGSIAIVLIFLALSAWKGYLAILFMIKTPMDEFTCSVDLSKLRENEFLDVLCKAPVSKITALYYT